MKHKFQLFKDLASSWHTASIPLQVPDRIQSLFHQLRMNPTTFKELWKKRCLLGDGFAECFHPDEERNWSVGSEGQNQIHTYVKTHLFVLKNLQDEECFCDIADLFFQAIGGFVTINLYFNQMTSSCFPPHYDCHDVFAFQLYGKKKWWIASPTKTLPTQLDPKNAPSTYPQSICTIGDTGLYLPWGQWHHAQPLGESIHMSIGIHDHPLCPVRISTT